MKIKKLKLTAQKKLKILRRDINLLWKSPIEYLYSFTYPADKMVHIEPYDPTVTRVGEYLVDKIHALYPYLK